MEGEFRGRFETDDPELELHFVEAYMEGLVRANLAWMRHMFAAGKAFPRALEDAGVVYEEPPKCSTWCQYADAAPVALRRKKATCFAVAAYVAALHRFGDVYAEALAYPQQNAYGKPIPHRFHALVYLPETDVIEDPTAQLPGSSEQCGSCRDEGAAA